MMRFALAIGAATIACVAAAEIPEWTAWHQVGPNELVTFGVEKDAKGTDIRSVSVRNRQWHEHVWVGGGFDIDREHRVCDAVSVEVRSEHPHVQLIKIVDEHGKAGVWNLWIGPQWQTLTMKLSSPHERQGGGTPAVAKWVEFSSFVRAPFDDVVSDVKVRTVRVHKKDIQPVNDRTWMPPRHAPPVKGYRAELTVHNVGNGTDYPGLGDERGYAMLMDISRHLYGLYGSSLGISVAYAEGPWAKRWAAWMKAKGCRVASEGHVSGGLDNLERLGALQRNRERKSYKDFLPNIDGSHGEDQTSGAWISWARGMVNRAGAAGADDFRPIDYVWPCHGAYSWCHGESALAFWPKALAGTDGGIALRSGGTMRFANYFRTYTGLELSPAFIGATGWADYMPPGHQERNGNRWVLQDLLCHYAWLISLNELGREAFAASGLKMKPVLNPEHIETGTDIWGLTHGKFVGGACVEWWGGADCAVSTYYSGPYFANAFDKAGCELVLTEETAAAGGNPYQGRPAYWDNQSVYAICYAKSAASRAKAVFNQYWQCSLERALDKTRPDHLMYTSFIASFDGFLQAKADGAERLKSDILVIANRAIADRSASFDRSLEGQPTASGHLMRMNYSHFAAAFPIEDSFRLEDFKCIFFNPARAPAGYSKKLSAWLNGGAGRTLVAYPKHLGAFFGDGRERVPGSEGVKTGEIKDGTGAVVADVRAAGKGRLIVFRRDLGQSEEAADDAAAILAVMKYLKARPTGVSEGNRFAALPFKTAKGFVYFIENRQASYDVEDSRGRGWWSFQHVSPSVAGSVRCRVGRPGAKWRMTDRITDNAIDLVADDEGYVTVSMDGFNLRLVELTVAK